jgi:uncharacterized protein YjbI with pentapeptide repeats
MANQEHVKILRRGVKIWNRWLAEDPHIRPDLSGADLGRANLHGAYLRRANLSRAYLSQANLIQTNLRGANLRAADLSGSYLTEADLSGTDMGGTRLSGAHMRATDLTKADLQGADLAGADLSWACLQWANLSGTNLTGANLTRADLTGASAGLTVFGELDLSEVTGLETVGHWGPSSIGVDTLYRSRGLIPEAFLRGAGLPDSFLAHAASLSGAAIQPCACFICYSSQDGAFAKRLYADLQRGGVRCWFAPEDIQGGRALCDQIDPSIRLHDRLLLVLSEHSLGSKWVTAGLRHARKAEHRDKRRRLFPIRLADIEKIMAWECLEAGTGQDLAAKAREYFIPDFSNWQEPESYQKALEQLVRDLKAESQR